MSRRKSTAVILLVLLVLLGLGLWWFMQPKSLVPALTSSAVTSPVTSSNAPRVIAKPSVAISPPQQNPIAGAPVPVETVPPAPAAANVPQLDFGTKQFHLDQTEAGIILAKQKAEPPSPASAGSDGTAEIEQVLIDVLMHEGVDFPSGSRIAFVWNSGTIYVTNTPENLAKIPDALYRAAYGPTPPPSTNLPSQLSH